MRTKLPISAWGHAILHASALEPNISHFKIFGCAIYVPIAPPQRSKMVPQRRLGIYVGFNSASIIKYLEPMTRDLFTARFVDCHFDEAMFPTLERDSKKWVNDIVWNNSSLTHLDPPTKQPANAPIRIEVLKEHISAKDSKPQLKRGTLIGSKDKNPRKRKGPYDQNMEANKEPKNVIVEEIPLEDTEPKKVEK
ncbi:hypothetical protein OSB04_001316 [Centaurea solstitialis]|uniref:Uncharacterized protein n=1 Tax=Centaurea solstitialis TaxID=347529 RepID=A0AA38TQS1_9ASTR|nr:hypothetical protein OSB04_001316 [Centaurea solstitialis]